MERSNRLLNSTKKSLPLLIMLAACSVMIGCSGNHRDYVSEYHTESLQHGVDRDSVAINFNYADAPQSLDSFINMFADLKGPTIANTIDQVYAESLYFNDTLHTFRDREKLKGYLLTAAEKVDESTVDVTEIIKGSDSYYLKWTMQLRFTILGSDRLSTSIGITQLRFDDAGQVVFHQDFWDQNQGVMNHVPVLGSILTQVRQRL